jgi:K+-transporting ATPase c subunit
MTGVSRNVSPNQVNPLIAQYMDSADLGFLGEARMNVLMLSLAVDQLFPASK